MNETQVKVKIFIMRTVDWILLLAVFGTGTWAIVYAEEGEMVALASIVGLFLVSKLGSYTNTKIATMKVDLEIEKRKLKQEQQRRK
ncbi:MAG: hypothetical protein HW386_1630 [Gammaproteobacteria bacterium]|nr:hypothetical protein [Gammaproteobacteria bacterium]